MIERLLNGHDRARQFLLDLRTLAGTVGTVLLWRAVPRPRPPAFPHRCQHCAAPIRAASGEHPAAKAAGVEFYRDRAGRYSCDGTIRIRHQPMPPIR